MPRAYNLSEMNVEGLIQGLGSRREAFAAQADEEFGAGNWSLVWAINTLTRIDDQDHQHWELRLYPKEAVLHLYEDGYYHLFLDNLDVARVLCETARDVFEVDELDCQAGTDWSAQEAGKPTHYQDIAIRRAMKRLSKKTGEDFSFRGERLVCVNESGDKIPTDARVGKWAGQEWHTLLSPGVVKAAYQHFAVDFAQLGINLLNQPTYGQWWEDGSVEAAYQQRVLVTR